MSRTTVGSRGWEEREAIAELEDATDALYAAGNVLLRLNARDPLGDACGRVAAAARKLAAEIKERGKRR